MDPSRSQKPVLFAAVGILIITVLLFVMVAFLSGRNTKVAQKNPATSETSYNDTSDVKPTISNAISEPTNDVPSNSQALITPNGSTIIQPTTNPSDKNTLSYSNPEKQFGFRYLKTWKIANKSTVTILTDPAKPQSQQCDILLPGMLYCDILISTIPYYDVKLIGPEVNFNVIPTAEPIPQQVKESAEALFGSSAIQPTLINNYRGYQAITQIEGTYIYNILLQGEKNMLFLQFPGKWSQSTLTFGQRVVLDSIAEI